DVEAERVVVEVGVECILPGRDRFQASDDGLAVHGALVVVRGGIDRIGLDVVPSRRLLPRERRGRLGHTETPPEPLIQVPADARDEVPMASLREAVLLELVEMRDQVVLETLVHPWGVRTIELEEVRVREGGGSRLAQCCEDLAEGGAAVGTRQTRDVLRDEPFGGGERERVNAEWEVGGE